MTTRSVLLIGSLMGGVATHLYDLIDGLAARDWNVHFFDLRQPFFSASVSAPRNVSVIPINPALPSRGATKDDLARGMYEAGNALLVEKAIRYLDTVTIPPALIHCHDYHGLDAAVRLSRILRTPLATTVHLLHEPMMRWTGDKPFGHCIEAERRMFKHADAVIAVSASLQQLIHATHPRTRGRTIVIQNGVETNLVATPRRGEDPLGLRSHFGLGEKRVVLYAGRFTSQKNLTALLHSAVRVVSEFPDVVYVLAGDDRNHPYVREMRRIVQEHAVLRSSVLFIGPQSSARLAALYSIASLVVLPSIYEGLPYFALEAMAAAVPIVAAATIGLSDLIEHRISGMLVPVRGHAIDSEEALRARRELDIGELADAQLELLGDPALANALGIAGRQRILAAYTKEMMLGATVDLYETLVDRGTVLNGATSGCSG